MVWLKQTNCCYPDADALLESDAASRLVMGWLKQTNCCYPDADALLESDAASRLLMGWLKQTNCCNADADGVVESDQLLPYGWGPRPKGAACLLVHQSMHNTCCAFSQHTDTSLSTPQGRDACTPRRLHMHPIIPPGDRVLGSLLGLTRSQTVCAHLTQPYVSCSPATCILPIAATHAEPPVARACRTPQAVLRPHLTSTALKHTLLEVAAAAAPLALPLQTHPSQPWRSPRSSPRLGLFW